MRTLIIFGIIFSFFISGYAQKIPSKLVGKWKLIEIYNNPGDDSGGILKVKSQKTITIKKDGQIESNGNLCNISSDSNLKTSGKINFESKTIISANCKSNIKTFLELKNGYLIINYPCKEGCFEKYEKLK